MFRLPVYSYLSRQKQKVLHSTKKNMNPTLLCYRRSWIQSSRWHHLNLNCQSEQNQFKVKSAWFRMIFDAYHLAESGQENFHTTYSVSKSPSFLANRIDSYHMDIQVDIYPKGSSQILTHRWTLVLLHTICCIPVTRSLCVLSWNWSRMRLHSHRHHCNPIYIGRASCCSWIHRLLDYHRL